MMVMMVGYGGEPDERRRRRRRRVAALTIGVMALTSS